MRWGLTREDGGAVDYSDGSESDEGERSELEHGDDSESEKKRAEGLRE